MVCFEMAYCEQLVVKWYVAEVTCCGMACYKRASSAVVDVSSVVGVSAVVDVLSIVRVLRTVFLLLIQLIQKWFVLKIKQWDDRYLFNYDVGSF